MASTAPTTGDKIRAQASSRPSPGEKKHEYQDCQDDDFRHDAPSAAETPSDDDPASLWLQATIPCRHPSPLWTPSILRTPVSGSRAGPSSAVGRHGGDDQTKPTIHGNSGEWLRSCCHRSVNPSANCSVDLTAHPVLP